MSGRELHGNWPELCDEGRHIDRRVRLAGHMYSFRWFLAVSSRAPAAISSALLLLHSSSPGEGRPQNDAREARHACLSLVNSPPRVSRPVGVVLAVRDDCSIQFSCPWR